MRRVTVNKTDTTAALCSGSTGGEAVKKQQEPAQEVSAPHRPTKQSRAREAAPCCSHSRRPSDGTLHTRHCRHRSCSPRHGCRIGHPGRSFAPAAHHSPPRGLGSRSREGGPPVETVAPASPPIRPTKGLPAGAALGVCFPGQTQPNAMRAELSPHNH